MAILDGDRAVYVAQVPSRHSMRMFTEVGRRVRLHSTGVGKALLAQLPDTTVRDLLSRSGMPAQTPQTITDIEALLTELGRVRRDGFAVDEGEQEHGVRCIAVPVPGAPSPTSISVSGPDTRLTTSDVDRVAPHVIHVASRFADQLVPVLTR